MMFNIFLIIFSLATTYLLCRSPRSRARKPRIITIEMVMTMPTHDTFRLRSYDDCDETESFQWCEYHYSRACACLDTPTFVEDYSPHEIVLPFTERIETPWDDDTHFYPYEWRLRLGSVGRKTKANK